LQSYGISRLLRYRGARAVTAVADGRCAAVTLPATLGNPAVNVSPFHVPGVAA
jgi:hypothetical protein